MKAEREIEKVDLPALHTAASKASTAAQQRYIALFVVNLVLLIAGAIFAAFSSQSESTKATLATAAGISFTLSTIVALSIAVRRYEKRWYGGRAIAESVKTLAWKYMTGADPYNIALSDKDADERFKLDLKAVLDQQRHLSGALSGELSNFPQITEEMKRVRTLKISERKDIYVKARLENQRRWYADKGKKNQRREWQWFLLILTAQALAAVFAFVLIRWPLAPFRLSGVFATLAAVSIAWLQVKRHQELSQSYTLATQELGLIAITAVHVQTDGELSRFVSDAESAVSREHTMWVARRDQV